MRNGGDSFDAGIAMMFEKRVANLKARRGDEEKRELGSPNFAAFL